MVGWQVVKQGKGVAELGRRVMEPGMGGRRRACMRSAEHGTRAQGCRSLTAAAPSMPLLSLAPVLLDARVQLLVHMKGKALHTLGMRMEGLARARLHG